MASIASKNLYELLGNDPELDPDREPEPPTRAIDKPLPRSGKRDTGPQPPAEPANRRGGRGGARNNATGNERAFNDRDAGSAQNRSRGPDDSVRRPDRAPRNSEYRGRGRGGPGGRGRGGRRGSAGNMDRHDKSGIAEHPKQAAHGWGGPTGPDELADEKAGEAIARAEESEGFDTSVPPPVGADGETLGEEPAEPEGPKSKSYEEYLAEQAEKKLNLGSNLQTRKPNEGTNKKFPEGKAYTRDEDDYIAGSGGKATRFREKKEKVAVDMSDVDPRSYLAEGDRQASRGGRGRGRGDRGSDRSRGGFRGDRGSDRSRGEFRGRGGRGPAPPRADDNKAFPSLGA
ncbi:uncharacterized protein PV09_02748 [Verruconis gallopava]|uniref:Hyaluronan/mRNA-binding protein domain-containing protein n=1 Tax=Verruconis gallopava TaxID=253628 RepID=A0A0D1YZZ5_9PEZI|nr:uncharacterized protein PV09_02748 [Verruconis gallopava]KIW06277.1 hypothetical protein PV09_02748 [Verruconis gallopava]